MKKNDFDCYVVVKNWQFLVAVPYRGCRAVRWSSSPYDAYQMKGIQEAMELALRVGGRVVEFNPLDGRVVN